MKLYHIICTVMLLLVVVSIAQSDTPLPVEIRAVWMDKNSIPKTEEGIRTLIRDYAKSGINIVHPEAIYNGYSAYPSAYLKQKDLWNGLDMLGIVIDEAHKNNIEVHPWVWVFRAGYVKDIGGILTDHPEWAAVGKDGKILTANNGYWLCPSIPAVRTLLINAFRELALKYPIDGIQLDYIRFEEQSPVEYCYNDSCRCQFKAACGIDPMELKPFTNQVIGWQLWRENLVNSFVAQTCTELRKVRPAIQISAAVGTNPDRARSNLLQDWVNWAANRWVDFLSPMDYTSNADDFARRQDASLKAIGNYALLAPGIGLYTMKNTQPMLDQIEVTRQKPVDGSTLFATAYLDADRLKALADGPFHESALLPTRAPIESARRLLLAAQNALEVSKSPETVVAVSHEIDKAKRLLDYDLYRTKVISYVSPTVPPIFIPERVQPVPEAKVAKAVSAPKIDGKLYDPVWKTATRIRIQSSNLGLDIAQPTDILLAYDKANLYIAFRAYEPDLNAIKASVTQRDGPIFSDDSVEMFIRTGNDQQYFHFAMNAIGTRFEQKGTATAYNSDWTGATGRESGAWTAEISVPFTSLIAGEPCPGASWKANFCRNRMTTGTPESSCWSPTYGSYHTPIRFGTLIF